MNKIIIAALLILLPTFTFAGGFMAKDSQNHYTDAFSPDGTFSTLLTVNSTTIDMTNNFIYSVIGVAATCKLRLMPTTAKGSYVAFPVAAASWSTYVVNPATPFANLSGCTAGYFLRQ